MTAQADRIARELEQLVERVQDEFAGRLLAKLRERTPIDPGYPADDPRHARNRWRVVRNGTSVDVYNDAEHVMELNDGSSTQAPAGFIEQCIDEVRAEMRSGRGTP